MRILRSTILITAALAFSLTVIPHLATGNKRLAESSVATVYAATPDLVNVAYARRYGIDVDLAGVIHRMALNHGLEPAAVFGLIATESGFNSRAVGMGGAVGLMQIKLATARAYDPSVTRERLFQPETNLRVGLTHLRRELSYFGYDWTLGLLAYNMGRGRLSEVLARGFIPRNAYASKVLSHCRERCS